MEDNVLENIWNQLTSDGLTTSSFEDWNTTFENDENVQQNVHNYLKDNEYTDSDFDTWKINIHEPGKLNSSVDVDPVTGLKLEGTGSKSGIGSSEQAPIEKNTWLEDLFGEEEDTEGSIGLVDFASDMWRAAKTGLAQGSSVGEAFDLWNYSGDESTLEDYLKAARDIEAAGGPSMEQRAATARVQELKKEGSSGLGAIFQAYWENPSAIAGVAVSSMAMMVSGLFDSEETAAAAAAGVAVGASAGAAIGSTGFLAGPLGIATTTGGAIAGGARVGLAALSGALETGLTTADLVQEQANDMGMSWDVMSDKERMAHLKKVVGNETLFNELKNKALRRGLTIGGIGLITAGATGSVGRGVTKKLATSSLSKITNKAARISEAVVETVGESTGEGLGQLAAGQEFNLEEIVLEGLAGKETSITTGILKINKGNPTYTINGEKRNGKQFSEDLKMMDDATIMEADIKVTNSPAVEKMFGNRVSDIQTDQKVDSRISGIDDRANAIKLTKEKRTLVKNKEGNKTRLAEIDLALKEIDTKYKDSKVNVTIQQRQEAVAKAIDNKFESTFNKNVKGAEKLAKDLGFEKGPQVFKTTKEFIKAVADSEFNGDLEAARKAVTEDGKGNATSVNGAFLGKGKMFIDKTVAKKMGEISVASHEILHPILNAVLGSIEEQGDMVKKFEKLLTRKQRANVEARIRKSGETDKKGIEYLTYFSDGIVSGEISYNEGLFTKIGDVIVGLLKKVGYEDIHFDSARGVYNFLKEYNKGIISGEGVSQKAVKAIQKRETERNTSAATVGKAVSKNKATKVKEVKTGTVVETKSQTRKNGDVVKTDYTAKVSEKEGIKKTTFEFERSDKKGKKGKAGVSPKVGVPDGWEIDTSEDVITEDGMTVTKVYEVREDTNPDSNQFGLSTATVEFSNKDGSFRGTVGLKRKKSTGQFSKTLSDLELELDELEDIEYELDEADYSAQKTNLEFKIRKAKEQGIKEPVKKEVKKETTEVFNKKVEESADEVFEVETKTSKPKVVSEKSLKLAAENTKISNEILAQGANRLSEIEDPDIRKDIRDRLIENNMGAVGELAGKSANIGKNIDEEIRVNYEDFLSGYKEQLIALTNTYKVKVGDKVVPFGAYMKPPLRIRYGQILKAAKQGKLDSTSSLSNEKTREVAESLSDDNSSKTSDGKDNVKLTDVRKAKIVVSKNRDGAIDKAVDLEGVDINSLNYKDTAEMFMDPMAQALLGISGDKASGKVTVTSKKAGEIDNGAVTAMQNLFKEPGEVKTFLRTLPEFNIATNETTVTLQGESIDVSKDKKGVAIGIGNRIKKALYEKYIDPKSKGDAESKRRSITSPLGRSKGEKSQTGVVRLKPEYRGTIAPEVINNFMAMLGLTPAGESRIPISGEARSEFGTMLQGATKIYLSNLINTVARENVAKTDTSSTTEAKLSTETKQVLANIGAGKSSLMFSKSIDDSLQIDGDHNALLDIQFSKKHRQAYENTLKKRRPLMEDVPKQVDNLFNWVKELDVPDNKKSKFEKLALYYMANGYISLPEDGYKVLEVNRIASAKKIDPYSYKNPNELLEKFSGEVKAKRVNPETVKTFSNKETLNDGATIYNVEESRQAQTDVRAVVDSNWGKKSNPWCLIARIDSDRNNDLEYHMDRLWEDTGVYWWTFSKFGSLDKADVFIKEMEGYGAEIETTKNRVEEVKGFVLEDSMEQAIEVLGRFKEIGGSIYAGDIEIVKDKFRVNYDFPAKWSWSIMADFDKTLQHPFEDIMYNEVKTEAENIIKENAEGKPELSKAWNLWKGYGKGKKIAFDPNGKLLAFRDGSEKRWWNRMDKPFTSIEELIDEDHSNKKDNLINDTEANLQFSKKGEELNSRFGDIKNWYNLNINNPDWETVGEPRFLKDYEEFIKQTKDLEGFRPSFFISPDNVSGVVKGDKIAKKKSEEARRKTRDKITEINRKHGVKSYGFASPTDAFGTTAEKISKSYSEGKVNRLNKKNLDIFIKTWKAIAKLARGNKAMIPFITHFLQTAGTDTSHWQRAGAIFRGYDPNPESVEVSRPLFRGSKIYKKVKVFYEYEHAVQQDLTAQTLMEAAFDEDVDFDKALEKVLENYYMIALSAADNKKVIKAGYGKKMPTGWKHWWNRYFNNKVAKFRGGINPNNLLLVDYIDDVAVEITFSEALGIDNKGEPMSFSKSLNKDFNKIIENKTGIAAYKTFASVKAALVGASKRRFNFFIPPSAEDFVGLLYSTLGRGTIGDTQMKWYKDNLLDPYARAMEKVSRDRNTLGRKFKELKKKLKIVPRNLKKKIEGSVFTKEQAVRVWIWDQIGEKVPGLSKADLAELSAMVEADPTLKAFAQEVMRLNPGTGYVKPTDSWVTGTITTDLLEALNTSGRKQHLELWQQNVDEIFSTSNLNKLEAAYGKSYRLAMENILQRMKTGRNRMFASDSLTGRFTDWLTGSIGAIMFFNTRSAVLQTISAVNFINFKENNIFAAGKAFANQPQFWSDFKMLFNSDFLVERRDGLKINVNEADIADIAKERGVRGVINKLLKLGFLPTQIADSFAIATGGATYYRNRLEALIKDGMHPEAAEKQALRDFREIAEESQQSSRPDKISQQQAGPLGRIVLAFANTPAQYARLIKKAASDLKNGRGDAKTNISKILYYGIAQNLIFNALQQALFATMFGDDDEEVDDKTVGIINGMVDSIARGTGLAGATFSVVKNTVIKIAKEKAKKNPKYEDAALEILKISPPISSKVTKLRSAGRSFSWDKKEMKKAGWGIDNPAYLAGGNIVSAATNIPLDRVVKKLNNVTASGAEEIALYQRIALLAGWSEWELGLSKKKKKKKSRSTRKGSSGRKRMNSRIKY